MIGSLFRTAAHFLRSQIIQCSKWSIPRDSVDRRGCWGRANGVPPPALRDRRRNAVCLRRLSLLTFNWGIRKNHSSIQEILCLIRSFSIHVLVLLKIFHTHRNKSDVDCPWSSIVFINQRVSSSFSTLTGCEIDCLAKFFVLLFGVWDLAIGIRNRLFGVIEIKGMFSQVLRTLVQGLDSEISHRIRYRAFKHDLLLSFRG